MNNESKLVLEIWDNFRDLIPVAKRNESAFLLLRSFEEYGFDFRLEDLKHEDEHLDHAVEMFEEEEHMDEGPEELE